MVVDRQISLSLCDTAFLDILVVLGVLYDLVVFVLFGLLSALILRVSELFTCVLIGTVQ